MNRSLERFREAWLLPVSALAILAFAVAGAGCAGVAPVRPGPRQESPERASAFVEAPAGSLSVRIESVPAGALIVVGDSVAGRAPVAVAVPATAQGFFREHVTIRARFLATDPEHQSESVFKEFTPLERVPDSIVFTPEGATAVGR